MHLTRAHTTKKLPIERKGTKYVARSLGGLKDSVPLVVAVRDMLKLARTAREVREMIKHKTLKINGREPKDYRQGIKLFNLLDADKTYILTLSTSKKFIFEETTKKTERPCKVIDKKVLSKSRVQLNLHDGTNVLTKENIGVNDTVYLDLSTKVKSTVAFEKGKDCFILSGKYTGQKGKVKELEDGKATITLKESSPSLDKKAVMVL